MAEQKNRWTWEVPGFEPRRSFELDDDQRPSFQPQPQQPILGRYSVSPSSIGLRSADLSRQQRLPVKLQKLKEQVKVPVDLALSFRLPFQKFVFVFLGVMGSLRKWK